MGVDLPVGLGSGRDAPMCHFRGCGCAKFEERKATGPTEDGEGSGCTFCACCGHKRSLHLSRAASTGMGHATSSAANPPPWPHGSGAGLAEVSDDSVLRAVQCLLDATHKRTCNWTQDRGCKRHGVHHCPLSCSHSNQVAVPCGYKVRRVWRNQNLELWGKYVLTRGKVLAESVGAARVESETSAHFKDGLPDLQVDANEWGLFHGASLPACVSICATSFSHTKARSGGTWSGQLPLYGDGFYFAERVTKADEYAKPSDEDPTAFHMLVCRVVGGRVKVQTSNDINKEALKQQVFKGDHHSVLGDRVSKLNKPYREFVVYDSNQIFPEFVVEYSRRYSSESPR
ncbi:unnamed protein product [Prorocentrum cordatum]|uniref:Poly [ADP-ribose] polymerase n=1 Tax=Prorocentrum cordatum TaxID=2364126 RepID=A0ABN9X3K3_9DINO|nr:unnamed protein product [Polarella glacialis]